MNAELRCLGKAAAGATLAAIVALLLQLPPLAIAPVTAAGCLLPLFWRAMRRKPPIDGALTLALQRIIEQIPDPVYLKDPGSRYLVVNQAFLQDYALRAEQVIGHTPEEIFGPDYGGKVRTEDLSLLAGVPVDKMEHAPNPITGRDRHLRVNKGLCVLPDGRRIIVGCNLNTTRWTETEDGLQTAIARETQLRERVQAFVQRLIDVIPDPVYVKDAQRRYVMMNEAFAQECGRTKEELLGLTSTELARTPEIADLSAREDAEVLAGGEVNKEQHTTLPISEEECFRIVRKRRCIDTDGQAVVVGAHFYITKWKLAERELQAALAREQALRQRTQEFTQRLIDVIPQPVYVKDAQSRYLMVNSAMTLDVGKPAEALLGRSPHELGYSREYAKIVEDEDQQVIHGVGISKEEHIVHPSNGKDVFRVISKTTCLNADGLQVIVGANFDITPWRQAEYALQNALQQQTQVLTFLQAVFDALPTPLFVENAQGQFVMVNQALARLLGSPQKDLIGTNSASRGLPSLPENVLLQEGIGHDRDRRIHHRDFSMTGEAGQLRHFVLFDTVGEGTDGQSVRIGVLSDITSLREAENLCRQAKDDAERASEAKSLFLANMSHEIRTPISGVIGTLRLALRDEKLAKATHDYLETGLSSAESLLGIINDILDFSKIEAGELKIEQIDIDLHKLVDDTVQVLRHAAQAKGLRFTLDMGPQVPHWVRGDPVRIRQVLTNLISNAIKFTQSGRITIMVDCDREDQAGRIAFAVRDTGIGIPPEMQGRLFQKFQQADSSTNRRFGGTGLGLAISRQLVEAMGGVIGVESQEGGGTTFRFTLPLLEGQKETGNPQAPQLKSARSLRILCAEDAAINRLIIGAMLESMGHSVVFVETGIAAVQILAEQDFDVVLMDGRMPEMDGEDATRAIRAGGLPGSKVRDPKIPIIALTANVSREDRDAYLAAGMDDFLTKPIDENRLFEALQKTGERLQASSAKPADRH